MEPYWKAKVSSVTTKRLYEAPATTEPVETHSDYQVERKTFNVHCIETILAKYIKFRSFQTWKPRHCFIPRINKSHFHCYHYRRHYYY